MTKTVIFALTAMLLYAGWAFLAKLATRGLPAEQAVIYTYVAGLGFAVAYVVFGNGPLTVAPRDVGIALVAGLFLGAGTISYYLALGSGSAAIATSISGMYLVGTTFLAVTFLDESLSTLNVVGVVLALCAVFLLAQ